MCSYQLHQNAAGLQQAAEVRQRYCAPFYGPCMVHVEACTLHQTYWARHQGPQKGTPSTGTPLKRTPWPGPLPKTV